MRTVYLLCCGNPALPEDQQHYISDTDLHLSPLGRMKGVLLGAYFLNISLSGVYHSILPCAQETAAFLSATSMSVYRLEETVNETIETVRSKAENTLCRLMDCTEQDIAVICAPGINQLLLCGWLGLPLEESQNIPQPFGCINILHYDGSWKVIGYGHLPVVPLNDSLCEQLWDAAGTPDRVRRHCRAVADKATEIALLPKNQGTPLDLDALRSAALLHDIARIHKRHADVGAEWVGELGFSHLSEWIAVHHELPESMEGICEAAVLFLADKLIQEDCEVSLEERFAKSFEKCRTPQEQKIHGQRRKQAQCLAGILLE